MRQKLLYALSLLLLTMLVVDLALGFIGKTMPQFNVFNIGTSMKTAVGILVLLAGLTITSETIREALFDSLATVRDAWSGMSQV